MGKSGSMSKARSLHLSWNDQRARSYPVKGYDEVGPLPYDPQNPPPEFRRTFFDEGHTREDLYMPTPRERENFKEFWRRRMKNYNGRPSLAR